MATLPEPVSAHSLGTLEPRILEPHSRAHSGKYGTLPRVCLHKVDNGSMWLLSREGVAEEGGDRWSWDEEAAGSVHVCDISVL